MRLMTRARYALARWAAKGMNWSYTPTWGARTVLNGAFQSLVAQGYQRNAAYFSCVSAHAFTFPEPPLHVYADEQEQSPALAAHPLRRLLARPNADMDEVAFASLVITWAAIGGNCYIHKERNRSGAVIGLRPYHDGVMRAVPVDDQDGIGDASGSWVSHFMFRQRDGEEVQIDKADVIHFQWPSADPLHPWKAQPPIVAAAREVDADNEATRYVSALLQNDATPRTVLTQSDHMALTPDEKERMRAEWSARHGGDQRGGIAILEAGVKVERLGLNMAELDFAALHDIPEQRICAVMKVPSPVAGLGDDPTYANSEEASKRFTTDTRVPLWRRYAGAVQAGLVADFGGSVVVRHALDRVAALQEDAAAKSTRVFAGYTAGLFGFAESRAMLGVTQAPDPRDLFVMQLSRELVPLAQLAAPVAEAITVLPPRQLPAPPRDVANDPAEDAAPKARPATKASGVRLARALQRVRREVAARMEPRIDAAFTLLADRVAARAEATGKARETKELPDLAQLLLPGDGLELGGIFRVFVLEILRASWELWNQALDVELAFDERDPAVVQAVAQSGARIVGITETTREAVQALLVFGAGEGWTIDQLVRGVADRPGLRDVVAQTYRGRARTIARTELGHAQATATVERYQAMGVQRVTILDNGVEDSDPVCASLNGTVQTLAWYQANPLQHPNCLRAAAPFFES